MIFRKKRKVPVLNLSTFYKCNKSVKMFPFLIKGKLFKVRLLIYKLNILVNNNNKVLTILSFFIKLQRKIIANYANNEQINIQVFSGENLLN